MNETPDESLAEALFGGAFEGHEEAFMRIVCQDLRELVAEQEVSHQSAERRAAHYARHADEGRRYFGLLLAYDAWADFDYQDNATGFDIHVGDPYVELHLPPVPERLRSWAAARESLRQLGRHVAEHRVPSKYIMGITYPRLAMAAHWRFGASVIFPQPTDLPPWAVGGVEQLLEGSYLGNDPRNQVAGRIALLFWETADFLQAYQ